MSNTQHGRGVVHVKRMFNRGTPFVVVDPGVRGQELGLRLTEAALRIAKARGSDIAFLLTTTAEKFFPNRGFERIARDEVPASGVRRVQIRVSLVRGCDEKAVGLGTWTPV